MFRDNLRLPWDTWPGMSSRSSTLSIRASGHIACFTRPEMKAERVSYSVITPSAARGILEAIFWKPAIAWKIDRISVLKPVSWMNFRRNEVMDRAASPTIGLIKDGGSVPFQSVEDDRAQRNTVALRDVDYIIAAHFELTAQAGATENVRKFEDMFTRRVNKGQHFHQPYMGCREFVADVQPVDDSAPSPISDSRDLGIMLWDLDYRERKGRPRFFHAHMINGVIDVPDNPEMTLEREGGMS